MKKVNPANLFINRNILDIRIMHTLAGFCLGAAICFLHVLVDNYLFRQEFSFHIALLDFFMYTLLCSGTGWWIGGRKQLTILESNKLKSIMEVIPSGVTIRDLQYNLIYYNKLVSNLFGNCVGNKCYVVFEGRESVCENCPVELCLADGKNHTLQNG